MKSAICMILPCMWLPYSFNKIAVVNCRDIIAVYSDITTMSKLLSIQQGSFTVAVPHSYIWHADMTGFPDMHWSDQSSQHGILKNPGGFYLHRTSRKRRKKKVSLFRCASIFLQIHRIMGLERTSTLHLLRLLHPKIWSTKTLSWRTIM